MLGRLHGIIEDTQSEFIEFIDLYARARVNGDKKATDAIHAIAKPKFESIGEKLKLDFQDLYDRAYVDHALDKVESLLN